MPVDFNASISPVPEQPNTSSAKAVPAEYGRIGLPSADKAPALKGAGNAVSPKTSAAAHSLPFLGPQGDVESKKLTNLFMSSEIRKL